MQIKQITEYDEKIFNRIFEVWENSVRATHDFLSEKDIEELKPMVKKALPSVEKLFCMYDEQCSVCAFMGINKNKIEMLFVDDSLRGKGIGGKLIKHAFDNLAVEFVDVNEQNTLATGFYKHMGFKTFERSETDPQGKHFPILHMRRELKTGK